MKMLATLRASQMLFLPACGTGQVSDHNRLLGRIPMSLLQNLLPFSGRRVEGGERQLSNRHVPSVEALEDRMMPAVSPLSMLLTAIHRGEAAGLHEFISVSGPNGTGTNGAFEIKDFSFGVENPTTIGSATG